VENAPRFSCQSCESEEANRRGESGARVLVIFSVGSCDFFH
jgi:hypothetical protein